MPKRKKDAENLAKPLDTFSTKRGRGRPAKVRASEVSGRAHNYRLIFSQIWDKIGDRLIAAQNQRELLAAIEGTPLKREFEGLLSLMLQVLLDPDFPKRDSKARANFLADSLAARGEVSPRSSRDVCERERAKTRRKSEHRIIRREYYIECSCGYKGPALDNACRECGADIPPFLGIVSGLGFR